MNDNTFVPWNILREYMQCMHGEVSRWEEFLLHRTIDWLPNEQIREWITELHNTLRILQELHIYDDLSSLSVNSESSGFPEARHLNQMQLLGECSPTEADISVLKQIFIDHLFETGKINTTLLEKIGKASAYQLQQNSLALAPFRFSNLRRVESPNGQKAYVCSWERYTVQSLPIKYVMLFDASDRWEPNRENLEPLTRVLQEDSSLILSLGDFARGIDRSNADIHPKWIGRVILGPVFISNLTQDDHQLQQALDKMAAPDEFLSASRIIYEFVVSKEEVNTTSLIDPRGIRHKKIQQYAVRSDGEHHTRGVTYLEKQLFAPHKVIQCLDAEYRNEIGHQLNSY